MSQPTVTTRSQGHAALAHLLQNIEVEVQDGPLTKGFKMCGITSVNHVTTLDEEEISTWCDPEQNAKDMSVCISQIKTLLAALDWYLTQDHSKLNTWLRFTPDIPAAHPAKISSKTTKTQGKQSPLLSVPTEQTQESTVPKQKLAKCSVADYPELKEDCKFRDGRCKFTAIATTQDIEHCLPPSNLPENNNSTDFNDANHFIYSVLVVKVHKKCTKSCLTLV